MEDEELELAEKIKFTKGMKSLQVGGDYRGDLRERAKSKNSQLTEISKGKMSKSKTSALLQRNPIRAASMNLTSKGKIAPVSGGSMIKATPLTNISQLNSSKGPSLVKSKSMSIGKGGDVFNSASTVEISPEGVSKNKTKNFAPDEPYSFSSDKKVFHGKNKIVKNKRKSFLGITRTKNVVITRN